MLFVFGLLLQKPWAWFRVRKHYFPILTLGYFYLFYSLVRSVLLCQLNGQVKYEASCLMVLLLFDEVAVALPNGGNGIPFSLPKSLVRRYVKVNEIKLLGSLVCEKDILQIETIYNRPSIPSIWSQPRFTEQWKIGLQNIMWSAVWWSNIWPFLSSILKQGEH